MPGGYIGVHTGLILAAQSESELAGVLAHEVSHVTQRHIARQLFQSKRIGIASMVAMGLGLAGCTFKSPGGKCCNCDFAGGGDFRAIGLLS
jgi:predicted Zn-dependent protease